MRRRSAGESAARRIAPLGAHLSPFPSRSARGPTSPPSCRTEHVPKGLSGPSGVIIFTSILMSIASGELRPIFSRQAARAPASPSFSAGGVRHGGPCRASDRRRRARPPDPARSRPAYGDHVAFEPQPSATAFDHAIAMFQIPLLEFFTSPLRSRPWRWRTTNAGGVRPAGRALGRHRQGGAQREGSGGSRRR